MKTFHITKYVLLLRTTVLCTVVYRNIMKLSCIASVVVFCNTTFFFGESRNFQSAEKKSAKFKCLLFSPKPQKWPVIRYLFPFCICYCKCMSSLYRCNFIIYENKDDWLRKYRPKVRKCNEPGFLRARIFFTWKIN